MAARQPVILIAALYVGLITGANELLFIVFGPWMENSFGLSLAGLGLASGVLGGAEICGELTAGWAVDRFGKRPIIITTGILTAVMYAVIPLARSSLAAALIALFFLFFFFEITIVGGIPLMTEVAPQARGVVMSTNLAASGLGRAAGALLGPVLWRGSLAGPGLAAALTMGVAVALLALFVTEASRRSD
jgi:predicted MFS family arabinose efflux permease